MIGLGGSFQRLNSISLAKNGHPTENKSWTKTSFQPPSNNCKFKTGNQRKHQFTSSKPHKIRFLATVNMVKCKVSFGGKGIKEDLPTGVSYEYNGAL